MGGSKFGPSHWLGVSLIQQLVATAQAVMCFGTDWRRKVRMYVLVWCLPPESLLTVMLSISTTAWSLSSVKISSFVKKSYRQLKLYTLINISVMTVFTRNIHTSRFKYICYNIWHIASILANNSLINTTNSEDKPYKCHTCVLQTIHLPKLRGLNWVRMHGNPNPNH